MVPYAAAAFSDKELARFESMLLERRKQLLGDFQSLEEAEIREAGALPVANPPREDLQTDRAAADVRFGCRQSASVEIQSIDDALERLRDGSFGNCESCDARMPKARLSAIPYARFCVACQKAEEI